MQGLPTGARPAEDGRGVVVGLGRRIAAAVATVLALATLALLAIHVLAPQRTGPLVVTQIFEPYLFLATVPLIALAAVIARRPLASALLVVLALAIGGRYAPSLISFPQALPAGAQAIHVMSWNMEAGGVPFDKMASTIEGRQPDIVGLIELVPEESGPAQNDPRLQQMFPYRALLPHSGVPGLGLLSRFPIVESRFNRAPPLLRAVIAPSDTDPPITVFVAHPFLAGIDIAGVVPDVDPLSRDAGITFIRSQIDAELSAGHDILVLGDFNVTEREPAYAELVRGLHDAQREAGYGLGLSWRPTQLERLPFGLLRIDYLLASPDFVASSAGPDCTPRGSDHCLIVATFARPRTR